MTRDTRITIKSLAVATMLATAALVPMAASAQEAITLETIGAVRMAQPSESEAPITQSRPAMPASTDATRVEHHASNRYPGARTMPSPHRHLGLRAGEISPDLAHDSAQPPVRGIVVVGRVPEH